MSAALSGSGFTSLSCHLLGTAVHRTGAGAVTVHDAGVRYWNLSCAKTTYTNAQVDDSSGRRRDEYRWAPPLELSLRARFSHSAGVLTGTAGFGFWNDPLMMSGARAPALPQALWFFYAGPDSDIALAQDVPGWGWKAAGINAANARFAALAPLIPTAALLMRSRFLYRRLWPIAQDALGVEESPVCIDIKRWRRYRIRWTPNHATFSIDGAPILHIADPPVGPLGLVIWLDSQAMIVRPDGTVRHRLVAKSAPQWMDVSDLQIVSLR